MPDTTLAPFNVEEIRKQFPILKRKVHKKPFIYFDNAATTQKPQAVIDAISHYYAQTNANIHRGIHTVAEEATAAFEESRQALAQFLNAKHAEEIIFTRGTTESINLAASTFGRHYLKKGDEVIISTMEHHSNIVPWQMACERQGAILKVIPVTDKGELDMEAYEEMLSEKTKMVSVVYASNSLGTVNPVKTIIQKAKAVGAKTLIDGAQSTAHFKIDVQDLNCDFYAMSSHKIYGPTGVGALYGRKELLEALPPYQGGGEMISEVDFDGTTYNELPYKFEAGTPNIADAVALKACLDFWNGIDRETLIAHETELLNHVHRELSTVDGLRFIGESDDKVSLVSFVIEGAHHQDLAIMLDNKGIAVRTGHHCCQPLMKRFGILGTARASFGIYNTKEEVNYFVEQLKRVSKIIRG